MGEQRRSLVTGLKETPTVDSVAARNFIHGNEKPPVDAKPNTLSVTPKPAPVVGRTAFSNRLRDDLFKALKQASLQRQIDGIEPNTVQDILEEVLEPWLRTHGYLK